MTSLLVDGFDVGLDGFLTAVVLFTVVQAVLTPFIASVARRYADAFLGGVGLVATFVSLFIAERFTDGLHIDGGVGTWVASVVLVWLVTALATWLLPMLFLRKRLQQRARGA